MNRFRCVWLLRLWWCLLWIFLSLSDRAQDEKHSEEVSHFQEELADAHAQLQILQKQLDDELNKQPLTNQEVQRGFVAKATSLFETSQSLFQYITVMP